MTLVGDPDDYIMIYGGVTNETVIQSDGGRSTLKKTLDDQWVFYVRSSQWNQIFPNSKTNPSKREFAIMTSVRADRAIFLFGGQYGEHLYNDLWQYNVNTNMWNFVILEDAKYLLERGGPADIAGALALNPFDLKLSKFQNCSTCMTC